MWAAENSNALRDAHNGIRRALIARGLAIFMESEQRAARGEALQRALEMAMAVGVDPLVVSWLSGLVLDTRMDAFGRALAGEPTTVVEPLTIKLEHGSAYQGRYSFERSNGGSRGTRILDSGRLPGGESVGGVGAVANAGSGDDFFPIKESVAPGILPDTASRKGSRFVDDCFTF